MNKPYLVSIDPGFGYHKGVSNYRYPFSFPSYACYGSLSDIRGFSDGTEINVNSLVVEYESQTIFLGKLARDLMPEDAQRPQSLNKAQDQLQRALILTTIALSLPPGSEYHSVYLGLGLSNASMASNYDESVIKWLDQDIHRITLYAGKTEVKYVIKVEGSIVRAQPEGTLIWESIDYKSLSGVRKWKDSFKDHIGVIDIGHNSSDATIFKTLRMVNPGRYNVATYGVSAVYDKLESLLANKFSTLNYSPRQSDLDSVLEGSKMLRIGGSQYDIAREIDAASRAVSVGIVNAVRNKWAQELPRLEAVWICGGGGLLLQEHLKREISALKIPEAKILVNAQYSNVLGFYMWGYLKYQKELAHITMETLGYE